MLRLAEVYAGYGKVTVVEDLTLTVEPGEVVTLIGANGAGKTTTLRAISGLMGTSRGSIHFEGADITRASAPERVARGITLVPEGRQLFPFMTVWENLMLGAFHPGAQEGREERLEGLLRLFPRVAERLRQQAVSLSGGEQQMVAIARGLMARPKLLMLDEPSLGLAPKLVKQVFDTVAAIAEGGTTVLIVEQNVYHTLNLAHRGYVLENGRITMGDTGSALLHNPHVKRAYLGI
ncbi:MAG: ABC transporter ATP-binding protein [Candidatus Competibacterales bacterium]